MWGTVVTHHIKEHEDNDEIWDSNNTIHNWSFYVEMAGGFSSLMASNVENVIIWVPPPDLIWFMAGVYETISLVLMVVSDTHAFNIRVSTKWPTFCRRHLQMHFPKWKYLYFNNSPLGNKSVLVQVVAWCLTSAGTYMHLPPSMIEKHHNTSIAQKRDPCSMPVNNFYDLSEIWGKKFHGLHRDAFQLRHQ